MWSTYIILLCDRKHANYELSVHVPLMIRVPWKPASAGKHTQSLTELLDIYRTVVSL